MQPTEKTYMTFEELAKNISLANDFATQYLYFVPTLKEIYDDQNLKNGTGELGAETISSIYKTIDIFKNDKKYISRIKMLRQLLDAQSDKSPSAKKFQQDFNFINSAFIDIDTANKLLDKIDTIQDESIKITILRTMTQTWRSRHPLAIKLRKRAATLATQSPNAELVDFRCLHNILDRGDPEREVALLSLDRKITELIGIELEKDTPNKKRIDTYIRIILEATETTYNNIFYPTAVQEEKIKAATEKFKLKSIQERAKEQKTAKTVPATAPAPTMTAPAQQDITLSRLQRENKEFMARISELEALTTEQETQLNKIKSQLAQANQENANNKKILQKFTDLAPAPTMTSPAQQDITLSQLQRENKEFTARISELEALTKEQETQLNKIKSQLAQANQENANNKKILQKFADLATSIKGDWYRAGPVKAIQKLAQELLSR